MMDLPYMTEALAALMGYILGSIPFGLVLAFMAGKGDIRKIGSGNIGATNVLRTGSKFLAALTLICDSGKGAAAVGLAMLWHPDLTVFAGGGAMLGHIFPIWLRFKGGKGVATSIGTLLAVAWPVGLTAILLWLSTAALLRISSLSALVAIGLSPFYGYYFSGMRVSELCAFIAALIFLRHKDNIKRLIKGQEPKIGK